MGEIHTLEAIAERYRGETMAGRWHPLLGENPNLDPGGQQALRDLLASLEKSDPQFAQALRVQRARFP